VIRSMRMRMTLGFILVMVPFLVISSHFVVLAMRMIHAGEAKETVGRAIKLGAASLQSPDWKTELTKIYGLDELRRRHIGALVVDDRGAVLWRSDSDAPKWPDPPHNLTTRMRVGDLTLYVNLQDFPNDEGPDARGLLIISLVSVIAVGLGSWLLVGRTLSPIRALSRQAAAGEGQLVAPSQDREMLELVSTLNGFLDRTREVSEEKARFYAAASHELRTPLQALMGHLELASAQPRSAEENQATVQEALVQTQRLASLVESILLLHQLQSSVVSVRESVCLSSVVLEQIQSIQPLVEVRQLLLRVSVEPGVVVSSIPMHVSVLVRNLFENAAKYSVSGGEVSISLAVSSGVAVLRIENAVGSVAMDRARLYEPFYRLDPSRSAKSGGNGLGLAICRAVVKANRWTLDVDLGDSTIVATAAFSV